MTDRSLKARYRGSILGVFWSLLNPLLMTAVYTAIFGFAFRQYYEGSIVLYAVTVFIGLTVLNFFSASTGQALSSVVVNSGLLNKIRLPVEVFPSSAVATHAVQLLVGVVPIIVAVTLVTTHEPLRLLLLPFPLVGLVLFSTGVAFAVSTAYVFFRDIPHIYELVTFLAWVTSPVFYPIAIVPAHIRQFLYLNPLFPTLESLREIAVSPTLPQAWLIGVSLLDGTLAFALGYLVFRGLRRQFMDLI